MYFVLFMCFSDFIEDITGSFILGLDKSPMLYKENVRDSDLPGRILYPFFSIYNEVRFYMPEVRRGTCKNIYWLIWDFLV